MAMADRSPLGRRGLVTDRAAPAREDVAELHFRILTGSASANPDARYSRHVRSSKIHKAMAREPRMRPLRLRMTKMK